MRLCYVLFVLLVLTWTSAPHVRSSSMVFGKVWKREASDEDIRNVRKMTTCVRNRFLRSSPTPAHVLKQERCVYLHVKRALQIRDRVACKFCDRFFFCKASVEAKTACGPHHHVKATLETVADCPEIRATGADRDDSLSEAVELGWSENSCNRNFLCSTGCRYASNNETCSLNCR